MLKADSGRSCASGGLPAAKRASEGDYTTYVGVDVNHQGRSEMYSIRLILISIKTVKNFDAVPLLVDIIKEG